MGPWYAPGSGYGWLLVETEDAKLSEDRGMVFRIGINLGDIIQEGARIYGDGVNVAAQMESLAEPGGICVSGSAFDQIENKIAFACEYLGEQTVKNISTPIRAYRLTSDESGRGCRVGTQVRNSSFSFQGKAVKVQQVAEEWGVRYVLGGEYPEVRRKGPDQCSIN